VLFRDLSHKNAWLNHTTTTSAVWLNFTQDRSNHWYIYRHKQLPLPGRKNKNRAYHASGKYWMRSWATYYGLNYYWLSHLLYMSNKRTWTWNQAQNWVAKLVASQKSGGVMAHPGLSLESPLFTTFGPPRKTFGKIHWWPPLGKNPFDAHGLKNIIPDTSCLYFHQNDMFFACYFYCYFFISLMTCVLFTPPVFLSPNTPFLDCSFPAQS